ncbi:hypothetical protein SAMN05519104_1207 [Rhizobiales bacterium GAS188]|nr:hypothetical protein SAMN05519104_1207 [Rhizobiales bacterium GAS188]
MAATILRSEAVKSQFPARSWQAVLFSEFSATMLSEIRPYPCVFGVNGFKADQLRYVFVDPLDAGAIAPALEEYLSQARSFGPNTSLIIFSRPGPIVPMERYRRRFWDILKDLAILDDKPWPAEIPDGLDTPGWEFCFGGEPLFVVCNTPAHIFRQSRRASSMMLTFQPRWVFENILGSKRAADLAFAKVRRRLAEYDLVPPAPALGRYGDPGTREFQQYFLDDTDRPAKCPFHSLTQPQKEKAA